MRANRFVYFGIAIALALVGAFTFVNARTSTALAQGDRVYDQIERTRAERWAKDGRADRSDVYDQIERMRAQRWIVVRMAPVERSRLEELARLKGDGYPGEAVFSGPSRLEQLERIKGDSLH